MGVPESKMPYHRENSINPANGSDNPDCEMSACTNNKSNQKSDADMTAMKTLDSKSSKKADQDMVVMNTIVRRRDRAVKLKRTCSKYTALDGKAADAGEIYEIDEQSEHDLTANADIDTFFAFHATCVSDRPDVCNEELEQDTTNATSQINDIGIAEERVTSCCAEYAGEEQREVRKNRSRSGRKGSHLRRNQRNFGDDYFPRKSREEFSNAIGASESNTDIYLPASESINKHKCNSRRRCDESNDKLSKKFAWPCSGSFSISSNADFENESTDETNDSYKPVEDYYADGNYISKSVAMPYNNLCLFSTNMESLERDLQTDNYLSKTTKLGDETARKAEHVYRQKVVNVFSESNIDDEMNSKNTYSVVRYPLRIKVNPFSDVCEVSLPKRMLDDLQVSRV